MADQTLFEAKRASTNNFFAYWRVGAVFHPDNPWDNPRYPLLAPRQTLADPAALASFDASPETRKREWEQRMHGDRVRPGNLAVFNDNIFRQQDANREDLRPPLPTAAVVAPAGGTGGGGPGALSNISPRTVVTAGQQQQPPQPPPPPSSEDRTPANVRAIAQGFAPGFAPSLRRFGVEIEMLRVLGHGGNGVVSLFRVQNRNRDARNRRKFVLKQLLRADANLLREKQFTTDLKRSRHIVQILRWRDEILRDVNLPVGRDMDQLLDGSSTLMPLEFMPHGDLWTFIMNCAKARKNIPDDMLWMIFACLVRACVAMYAPTRRIPNPDGTEDWFDELGPEMDELMPARRSRPGSEYDLVHFDLDPQNILIGNFDDELHRGAPIFKIGDLGLSKRSTDPTFRNDPYMAWSWRRMAKRDFFLPEQFHKEWEYIQTTPAQHRPPPRVAGQYGSHSNVYAIALCMQFLITQAQPPLPPSPIGPLNHPETINLLAGGAPIRDFNMRVVPSFWTYGFNMARIERPFDNTLCHVLLRCMAEAPADRPSLEELVNFVEWKEAAWDDAAYDRVRAFARTCFHEPPAAPSSATGPASTAQVG